MAQNCCLSNIKSKTFFSIKCKQIKSKQTYLLDWLGLTGGPCGLSGGLWGRLPSGLNWAFTKPNHTTGTNINNNTLLIILTEFLFKNNFFSIYLTCFLIFFVKRYYSLLTILTTCSSSRQLPMPWGGQRKVKSAGLISPPARFVRLPV